MKLDDFLKFVSTLPVDDYVVHLKLKYNHEDKTIVIPDIPLNKYDLNSILVFAHQFIDHFMIHRYQTWRKS